MPPHDAIGMMDAVILAPANCRDPSKSPCDGWAGGRTIAMDVGADEAALQAVLANARSDSRMLLNAVAKGNAVAPRMADAAAPMLPDIPSYWNRLGQPC